MKKLFIILVIVAMCISFGYDHFYIQTKKDLTPTEIDQGLHELENGLVNQWKIQESSGNENIPVVRYQFPSQEQIGRQSSTIYSVAPNPNEVRLGGTVNEGQDGQRVIEFFIELDASGSDQDAEKPFGPENLELIPKTFKLKPFNLTPYGQPLESDETKVEIWIIKDKK